MTRQPTRTLLSIAGIWVISFTLHCQNASQSPLPEGGALVFQGGSTATAIFDAQALTFNISTTLPEALGPGTSSFQILAGEHSGKVMTILGKSDNSTGKTFLFDPITGLFSAGTPLAYGMAQTGVHFNNRISKHLHLYSRNDAYVHAYDANNQIWAIVGSSVPDNSPPLAVHLNHGSHVWTAILRNSSTTFYEHGTHNSALIAVVPVQVRAGANVSIINAGANASKGLLISGGGLAETYILTPLPGQIVPAPGPTIQQTPYPNLGSCSPAIESGVHAGKILVVHGATSTVTSIYNATTNAFETGPALSASAGDGAHIIAISTGTHAGKFLVIHGNNSATTSLYEPSTGQFAVGPSLPFSLSAGGHSVSLD